ncbi:hypothetical protein AVEN_255018-1 [Araneus ventricosus]|uniref:Transposase Tc1-like domain-containing protein n=1 Tax=Araneus ventricosus TaxID=182803 RepID=A0A4Y2VYI7_ARAVE|nr:hypothetical protein AVEN_255018-1 [Araneus ventricosus]
MGHLQVCERENSSTDVINMGSQSRRSTLVPFLTARYKALLLSWARQHQYWTVDDWKHVAWSDECPIVSDGCTCTSMETTSLIHRPCLSTGD